MNIRNRAQELLEEMLGYGATFRQDQWEAIEAIVVEKRRAVYFLGTKLLRENRACTCSFSNRGT